MENKYTHLFKMDKLKNTKNSQFIYLRLHLHAAWPSECVCYLRVAPSGCCTRCLCVLRRRCGGAVCPPSVCSLSSCSRTEPRRAQLLPTAGPRLAGASPSPQTRPAVAPRLAVARTPQLHRDRKS